MAKLTKAKRAAHNKALEILEQDILSDQDKEFVFANYHEGAEMMNGDAGAFFTPLGMAECFAHDSMGDTCGTCNDRVIDLCAGIGVLAYALIQRYGREGIKLVCVEKNPEYVRVGKKLVPEAQWYCADVMDTDFMLSLGHFNTAVSNPPFGRIATLSKKQAFNYNGQEAEYKVMDVASVIADDICFIVPQSSAGFSYSKVSCFSSMETSKFIKFSEVTNIDLEPGIGYDTSDAYMGTFKDVNITVEFVHADTSHISVIIDDEPVQTSLF